MKMGDGAGGQRLSPSWTGNGGEDHDGVPRLPLQPRGRDESEDEDVLYRTRELW